MCIRDRATLSDYFDLNRRYFNITDTIIFEDRMIKLDMIPKYYFKEDVYKRQGSSCGIKIYFIYAIINFILAY